MSTRMDTVSKRVKKSKNHINTKSALNYSCILQSGMYFSVSYALHILLTGSAIWFYVTRKLGHVATGCWDWCFLPLCPVRIFSAARAPHFSLANRGVPRIGACTFGGGITISSSNYHRHPHGCQYRRAREDTRRSMFAMCVIQCTCVI